LKQERCQFFTEGIATKFHCPAKSYQSHDRLNRLLKRLNPVRHKPDIYHQQHFAQICVIWLHKFFPYLKKPFFQFPSNMRFKILFIVLLELIVFDLQAQTNSICSGSLLLLNTNDAVQLPAPTGSNYYSANGFTWECWIKLSTPFSSYTSSLLRPIICAIDPVVYEDICLSFGWTGGIGNVPITSLAFKVDGPNGNTGPSNVTCNYTPIGGFQLGIWYHVAGSMDYQNHISRLYLNGSLVDTKTVYSAPITRLINSQLSWDVGLNPGYPNPSLGGNIYEVRIWNSVRSDTEVSTYYNQCLNGSEPNLMLYYRCNQKSGTSAIDGTSNNNAGSLVSTASWSLDQAPITSATCTKGCCTSYPMATANASATTIKLGETTQLTGGGGSMYLWTPAYGLSCTTCSTPSASPLSTTNYCALVTDTSGCTNTACVTINIESCPDIFVPNVFSPNGDGVNDQFFFKSTNMQTLRCQIYNRWGMLVWELSNPNESWDGYTKTGSTCSDGVYFYSLDASCAAGKVYHQTGYIHLLR
jgi:gliding motility-associated-like protein